VGLKLRAGRRRRQASQLSAEPLVGLKPSGVCRPRTADMLSAEPLVGLKQTVWRTYSVTPSFSRTPRGFEASAPPSRISDLDAFSRTPRGFEA